MHAWNVASLTPGAMARFEAELPAALGWREGVPIATCQRYEFVSVDNLAPGASDRVYHGEEALLHLASLAAGLDSLVLGEVQIFGQVRTALSKAPADIRRMTAASLAAARALRREAAFNEHAGHSLDHALAQAGVPAEGRLLVLGGGVMGRRVAERAVELGFDVTIATRQPVSLGVPVISAPLQQVAHLAPFEVVAGCLGAGAPRYEKQHLPEITRLAADFGTPRNLGDCFDAPLVTVASMLAHQTSRPAEQARREALRTRLRELLQERLVMARASGDSPLGVMRGEVEQIRQRELARAVRLHPELPVSVLDTITRSLVNQIFHRPSLRLRRADDHALAEELAALFQAPSPHEEIGNDDR